MARFAEYDRAIEQHVAEGANYPPVCDSATGDQAAKCIRPMIFDQRGEFAMKYPCYSPTEWYWCVARETSFPADGRLRAVITRENITERKRMEEYIRAPDAQAAEALSTKELAGVVSRSPAVE